MADVTRWNGRPCKAEKVRVVVGDDGFFPRYWAREEGLVGQEIEAVKVWDADQAGDQPFYLDNRDGSGWTKVTNGGGPSLGHRDITIEREVTT